jgi:tetratricopeptide (TPR) repeat protein
MFNEPYPTARDDPQYAEGMAHLQSAEWAEAARCFEALHARYGNDPAVLRALDQARFKARLDAATHVRAKRFAFRFRPVVVGVLLVAAVLALGVLVVQAVDRQVLPAVRLSQLKNNIDGQLAAGQAALESWKLDEAEVAFWNVQRLDPGNARAAEGLKLVAERRKLKALCDEANKFFSDGELSRARERYSDLATQAPGYCASATRITEINDRLRRDDLWQAAEAAYAAGSYGDAVSLYEQIQLIDVNFQRDTILERLYDSHMSLGRAAIEADPPQPEQVPAALDHFTRALAARPRDTEAATEQRLASLFLAGQQSYEAGRYADAAARLGAVYEGRPGYLGAAVINPLYDALIRSGDTYRAIPDYGLAFEQYRRACALPDVDRALCQARMDEVRQFLTPTPTPSITPTVTPLPTPTPYIYVPPTAIPTGTPAPPLASFRNQIVFKSADEKQPGFWVMNPDGTNLRFLGDLNARGLQQQYDALIEREKLSPDGRYHVYVTTGDSDKSPQLYIQGFEKDQYGNLPTQQVTRQEGLNYDPAWAPDGSRIAFVSTHQGTDDLWVVNPDGANMWNYTPNKWEWDKHPSWSPDSQKIVFWSNREGTKQIFMIDANGQNLKKVHAVPWDEYDPIWIK